MRLKARSEEDERKFITQVQEILADPGVLVPQCLDPGLFCPFEGYRKKLRAVDSPGDLLRFSRSADQFLSGLAESARAVESGGARLTAMLKTQYGSVEYIQRGGGTDPPVLAGIQNGRDVVWRMLAFTSLSKTRGVKVYSSSNYYLASCKSTPPPPEFFQDALRDEGIATGVSDGIVEVGTSGLSVLVGFLGKPVLRIREDSSWRSGAALMKHILVGEAGAFSFMPEFLDEVQVDVQQHLLSYLAGQADDRAVVRKVYDSKVESAVRSGFYVSRMKVYSDPEAFLKSLDPVDVPAEVLIKYMRKYGRGMQADTGRKVLEALWPQFSREILADTVPGLGEDAGKFSKGQPLEMIAAAREYVMRKGAGLPFEPWSEDSRFLADIIVEYRLFGKERAADFALRNMGYSEMRRVISLSFLYFTGAVSAGEWKFSEHEAALARILEKSLRALIEGNDISALRDIRAVIG